MDDAAQTLFITVLRDGAARLGITLPEAAAASFMRHARRMLEFNAHTNLTRITDPAEVAVKHFLDSLTLLLACPDIPARARVADIGTGAGFPGLPLKVLRPDLRIVLADSLNKRLAFLAEVARELDLADISLVHARAEDMGRDPAHRDGFDLVTARAVAALPTLLEWCAPLVRVGGRFVAMKTAGAEEERTAAEKAMRALNVCLAQDLSLSLPPTGEDAAPSVRRLLVFEKHAPTPPRYPRRPAEIKAKPL